MSIASVKSRQARRATPEIDPTGSVSPTVVAPPPKLRRRPVLIAASAAAICLGALLGVWAFTSMSSSHDVLAVRSTVQRGQIITSADLMRVQVGVDPALKPLSADQMDQVVGKRAALDLAAGGLVTAEDVTSTVLPAGGQSVVGINLAPGSLPGVALMNGDKVRLVQTPGNQGTYSAGQSPQEIDATVVDVQAATGGNGSQIVDVLVQNSQAADVAEMASTGKVALVLDSRER